MVVACAPVGIVAAPVVVTVRAVRVRRGVLGPVCRAADLGSVTAGVDGFGGGAAALALFYLP
ncbi:hypothetical protein T492DRAFT_863612 [Pavlovales sp. CCMP2436]|nr:hypothetical protein T492DRAFT_863612 [Pavlovales sp. CCMP2436]